MNETVFHPLGPDPHICTNVPVWTEDWLSECQQPNGGTLVRCGNCRETGILADPGQQPRFFRAMGFNVVEVQQPTPVSSAPGAVDQLPVLAREASSRASERTGPVKPPRTEAGGGWMT